MTTIIGMTCTIIGAAALTKAIMHLISYLDRR